ncbi:MAG: peptidase [Hyphomicrobiales bacterium]
MSRRAALQALVGMAALAAGPALADRRHRHHDDDHDADDHDLAHEALERGEVRPLAEILGRIKPSLPENAEIVDISFARRDGQWLYRFKLIDGAGARSVMLVDAATGEIVETREH